MPKAKLPYKVVIEKGDNYWKVGNEFGFVKCDSLEDARNIKKHWFGDEE